MQGEGTARGVLTCRGFGARKNIGDYIQSLAAAQFAGAGAIRVERERLDAYAGPRVRLAMNAWFMHEPGRFPPSSAIEPLFVSFHVRPKIENEFFTPRTVAYLKAHEPIGCRSTDMVAMLARYGIDGEFTSCLTLTLGETFKHREAPGSPPVFVDPFFRRLPRGRAWLAIPRFLALLPYALRHFRVVAALRRRMKFPPLWPYAWFAPVRWLYAAEFHRAYSSAFGDDVLVAAEYLTHDVSKKECPDEDAMFAKAEALLRRYECAPFVVTSRLHCTLPCLAMGTPVWTVIAPSMKTGRFGGNERFMNVLKYGRDGHVRPLPPLASRDGRYHLCDSPPVKTTHRQYAATLAKRMREFMA